MLWLAACPSDGDPSPHTLDFDGVGSVTWDGADGLVVEWAAATGSAGGYRYVASVGTVEVETAERTAHVTGLADGEYDVRVRVLDAEGVRAGDDVVLRQLVGPNRLVYRSELPFAGGMDIAGDGDLVALAGGLHASTDVLLVDVGDPTAPVEVARIEGLGQVRDVALADGRLYAASDCNCESGDASHADWDHVGARIFDVSQPASPVLLAEIGPPHESVHTLAWAGRLYLASQLADVVAIYEDTTLVGTWAPPGSAPHDQTVVGDTLYVAWPTGWSVVDVADPSQPSTVSMYTTTEDTPSFHNVWPVGDSHVYTTQEKIGGTLEAWTLEGERVWAWPEPEENTVHTVVIDGDLAYVAWYLDGVRVFDVADPTDPTLIGWYDTVAEEPPAPQGVPYIHGAWDVWPFGDHVVVSDTQRGVLVFDLYPLTVTREDEA